MLLGSRIQSKNWLERVGKDSQVPIQVALDSSTGGTPCAGGRNGIVDWKILNLVLACVNSTCLRRST